MDLHDYIDVIRQRWRFVVVCVLLGLAGAVAATILTPRTYTATAQLFVATRDPNSAAAYQGGLFTQERVKSYTRIVTNPTVLAGVISELQLRTTPEELAKKISAQAPLDTTLVDIRVGDGSPFLAQDIADETAKQFTKYITAVEGSPAGAPPLVKASVVGGSQPPTTPTSPRPGLNIAIGILAGLAVGVGGAVVRNSLDTALRSGRDIRTHLNLTTVGVLPPPDPDRPNSWQSSGPTPRTEALNQFRTQLRFGAGGSLPGSLLIAGALPEEGRTSTAIDLATGVARTGQNVIILEADLRRPRLAEELGLPAGPGLVGVLSGECALYDALQNWGDARIRVLPSGPVPGDPNTLLSSSEMKALVRSLESDGGLVVVDSPPLLPYADAVALASVTEGVLFVVRSGRTRRDDASRALDSLAAVHARVLGAVLTAAPAGRRPRRAPDRPSRSRYERSSPAGRAMAPGAGTHRDQAG
ncbi:polysaccharide biosynthesis tyrosine autokinase [Streptomyces sp. LUP30]|uniref:polysaccharide biosynthesis tyrosine autokinase n=1 Tax=Streptomyces sp. LUP30 TaxID=1890285 RepID=UPI000851B179|nr:polysaccharide biosynthesis tyrosine autokinase [Streptomyces sp. LUP30]